MFIFGFLEDQVAGITQRARSGHYPIDHRMEEVFNLIRRGDFSLGDKTATQEFNSLISKLSNTFEAGTWNGDKYLLCADFPSYCDAQELVDATYADKKKWTALSIQAACGMAKFSSDRTIREYAEQIWEIMPAPRPLPSGATGGYANGVANGVAKGGIFSSKKLLEESSKSGYLS